MTTKEKNRDRAAYKELGIRAAIRVLLSNKSHRGIHPSTMRAARKRLAGDWAVPLAIDPREYTHASRAAEGTPVVYIFDGVYRLVDGSFTGYLVRFRDGFLRLLDPAAPNFVTEKLVSDGKGVAWEGRIIS